MQERLQTKKHLKAEKLGRMDFPPSEPDQSTTPAGAPSPSEEGPQGPSELALRTREIGPTDGVTRVCGEELTQTTFRQKQE